LGNIATSTLILNILPKTRTNNYNGQIDDLQSQIDDLEQKNRNLEDQIKNDKINY
jgi:cell division protein FtsL